MDPAEQFIDIDREDGIGWLVLNRPDRLNAMNRQMLAQFGQAVEELEQDGRIRVIIIRGAGRAFSTGYDIERKPPGEPETQDPVADYVRLSGNIERFQRLWTCPKPVIAAVHGYCLAGATQMCVFTDLTIVAENAVIGMPKIPVGGGYITPMWAWLVGPKRAKHMSFSAGRSIDGTTAVEWGWANYAVPEAELIDEARAVAHDIARTPAAILAMKKHSVNRMMDLQGFSSAVALGAETDALLHTSAEVQRLKAAIREGGLKEAIGRFERGELA